ncbi:MAG: cytochrome C [Deltaproteobacteria bacterium]|nr:cytochrome C [Deltaproteobacteria bacterium]
MSRFIGIALVVAGFVMLPLAAQAQITGSAHDFSDGSVFTTGGEICVPCHAPHGNQNAAGNVLWNHDTTVAAFTMYSNPSTLTGSMNAAPGTTSLLCLSCHDGTVALDSFGGAAGAVFATGGALVDTDLTNDHPIGVEYTAATAATDGELVDPSVAGSSPLGAGTITADLLFADRVECASCHDVHNTANQAGLLHVSNAASALCLACHIK